MRARESWGQRLVDEMVPHINAGLGRVVAQCPRKICSSLSHLLPVRQGTFGQMIFKKELDAFIIIIPFKKTHCFVI